MAMGPLVAFLALDVGPAVGSGPIKQDRQAILFGGMPSYGCLLAKRRLRNLRQRHP